MRPPRPTRIADKDRFFALWHNESLTICEIARELGVSEQTVSLTGKRFGFDPRKRPMDMDNEPPPVDDDEEFASCESLRLAPTVAALAAEVRSRWTEQERYSRRVQKVRAVEVPTFRFPTRCDTGC